MMEMERVAVVEGSMLDTGKPNTYMAILLDLFPLFFLAFSIFFLKGMRGLRTSFMGQSFLARLISVIISSALGSALAVGCALLLPLFHNHPDPAAMLGIVVFVAVAGVKIVDGFLYKKLGVHFIDTSDSDSADSEWMRMTQEERRECLQHWRETHEESIDE